MRYVSALVLLLFFVPGALYAQVGSNRTVTVGVVKDGPAPFDLATEIERELQILVRSDVSVSFKRSPAFDAGWDPDRAAGAVGAALNDPQIDILLVTGFITGQAARVTDLTKPTIAASIIRMDAFNLYDQENDRSTKPNLSFTLIPRRVATDLETFREMFSFSTVDVALSPRHLQGLEKLDDEIRALENELGTTLRIWEVSGSTGEAMIASLPADAQAVALLYTPQLSRSQRTDLIRSLNTKKIPTFSLVGHEDVFEGALAARTPDLIERQARRAALNLSEVIRGRPVAELPVLMNVDASLLINGSTAAAIGYAPDFRVLAEGRVLNEEALLRQEQRITLAEVLTLAQQNNTSLAISTQDVETAKQDKNLARSPLLPQLRFVPSYKAVNADALGLGGRLPDHSINATFQLNQMIYDDRRVSDFRAQSRLHLSSEEARDSQRLDVMAAAGGAYFNLALAQLIYQVQASNVTLTEENLEIAKLRLDVGYSGPDEVFRWEAELAKRRSELFNTRAAIDAQQFELNQILGGSLDQRWEPEETVVDPEIVPFLGGRLSGIMANTASMPRVRDALVQFAVTNAPELKSLEWGMEAQEITLNQRKRRWWLPSFMANVNYNYQAYRDPDIDGLPREIPLFEVRADYPIFEGAARAHEVSKASSQLSRLTYEQKLVLERIEQRTRAAVSRMENSFPIIGLSQTSADRARRNLTIVQDKYGQGLVNITDLLEAQNESFSADQNAAAAVYTFLIDLVSLQRALSWFELEHSSQERDELFRIIQDAIAGQ